MEGKTKIDIKQLCAKLIQRRFLFVKVLSVVLVVSVLWIFTQPRYYNCSIQLAPESSEGGAIGGIGSLASSFGFNLGGISSGDAIYPSIYPQVVSSTDFLVSLFDIRIASHDGEINTTYYDYIKNYTKTSILMKPFFWMKRLLKNLFRTQNLGNPNKKENDVDPFWLTEDENSIAYIIGNNISCVVDEEYQVVTINVTDQDPLICATVADSVRVRLQGYVTNYRTSKARNDLEYFSKLTEEAKKQYDEACNEYAVYADSHFKPSLKRTSTSIEKLENSMQQAYTTYNAFLVQKQTAAAKVQECTPAFTVIQGASVPIKPAGPKRMLFCLGMLILGFMGTSFYVLRKDIFG